MKFSLDIWIYLVSRMRSFIENKIVITDLNIE